MVLELIRTTVLAGLGAGVITKEKAEQVMDRLVDEGKVTADEAKQLVNDLLESGSRQWQEVQDGLNNTVRQALDAMDLPRKPEVAELARRLEKAEQRIAMLESELDRRGRAEPAAPAGIPPREER